MISKDEFKRMVSEVQAAMDNSSDTRGAISSILLGVYTKGVKRGVSDGYRVGYVDGKKGANARGKDIAGGVVERARSDVVGELSGSKSDTAAA